MLADRLVTRQTVATRPNGPPAPPTRRPRRLRRPPATPPRGGSDSARARDPLQAQCGCRFPDVVVQRRTTSRTPCFDLDLDRKGCRAKHEPPSSKVVERLRAVARHDYFVTDVALAQGAKHKRLVVSVVLYQQNDAVFHDAECSSSSVKNRVAPRSISPSAQT